MIASRGAKGGTNYTPRVRFTAHDGSTHEFLGSSSSGATRYFVGQNMLVAYNANSYEGRVLTFGQRFGFPSFVIVFGLAVILLATTFRVGRECVPRIYLEQSAKIWPDDLRSE